MPLKFTPKYIPDVMLIEPKSFPDERGYFFENYKRSDFTSNGIPDEFVQDNTSSSMKNVLRGLHFQAPPYEQGKLIRVIVGEIIDVAVDIRKNSSTYGQWTSETLSGKNRRMLWVPPGFAHGFLSLKRSIVHYKVTREYNRVSEKGIIWNDPDLRIEWPVKNIKLSLKDTKWPTFKELDSPFVYGER